MVKITEKTNTIRRVADTQPGNLILPVPATIRDVMDYHHGSDVKWEACIDDNGVKYVKLISINK